MENQPKKLYISEDHSFIWGILAGIGEYFDIDPTLIRLGFIIVVLLTGIFPGIIAYIVAYFIIPDRPKNEPSQSEPIQTAPIAEEQPSHANENNPADTNMHDADIGELKRPNWPTIPQNLPVAEPGPETPTLDSILDERDIGLDDLIDE